MKQAKTSDFIYYISLDSTAPSTINFDNPVDDSELLLEAASYHLVGEGFTELSYSPNAETTEKAYINQNSMTTNTTSYNNVFEGTADLVYDNPAVMSCYNVHLKNHTGDKAQRTFLAVEGYEDIGEVGTPAYMARLFRVSVSTDTRSGTAPEDTIFGVTLSGVKDPVFGTYTPSTNTFTVDNSLKD